MESIKDQLIHICSVLSGRCTKSIWSCYCSVSILIYSPQKLCTLGRFWLKSPGTPHSPFPWLREMNHLLRIIPNTFKSGIVASFIFKHKIIRTVYQPTGFLVRWALNCCMWLLYHGKISLSHFFQLPLLLFSSHRSIGGEALSRPHCFWISKISRLIPSRD